MLRYKDVCKHDLKPKAEISPESRESTAGNRIAWGAVSHGVQTAGDNRNIQSTARRASQKVRAATPSTFLCDKCGKDWHSRVGLYSHSRSANGLTECCMLYYHLSRWTDAKKKVVALRYVYECIPLLRLSIACGLWNSKLKWQMRFSLLSIKCSAAPPSFRLCCLNCSRRFDLIIALGSSGKLGGAAEHLIDGSEKRICRLSFEF